jgi:hypothetical protein
MDLALENVKKFQAVAEAHAAFNQKHLSQLYVPQNLRFDQKDERRCCSFRYNNADAVALYDTEIITL